VATFFNQVALNEVEPDLQMAWRAAAAKMSTESGRFYSGKNFDPPEFAGGNLKASWEGFLPLPLIGQLPFALRQFTGPSYLHL